MTNRKQSMPGAASPSPLRIAFLLKKFPVLSETFILNQITGLMSLGHEVDIFALAVADDDLHHPSFLEYGLAARITCLKPPRSPSKRFSGALTAIRKHVFRHPVAVFRALDFFRHGRRSATLHLINFIAPLLNDYDIIQCHYGDTGLLGVDFKEMGVPGKLVTMFHGYDIRLGIEKGGDIYQKLFETGDLFLSISDYNTTHLLAFGLPGNKITKLPCGIDTGRFKGSSVKTRNGGEPAKLLTVGRLVEEKSIDTALEALARLKKARPDLPFRYTIIGDGPLRAELSALAASLDISDQVHFLGARSQEDVASEMSQTDIFVLPSRAEALPVCIMEAAASGLPVLATRVGSVHELVLEGITGRLVPPRDIDAMQDAVTSLLENPGSWEAMGIAGRTHIVENFDTTLLANRLVEIYRNMLDKPNGLSPRMHKSKALQ